MARGYDKFPPGSQTRLIQAANELALRVEIALHAYTADDLKASPTMRDLARALVRFNAEKESAKFR